MTADLVSLPGPCATAPQRNRLPAVRTWAYEYDGCITDVTVTLASTWPEVIVSIVPRGQGLTIEGQFTADGGLRRLAFTAGRGEVGSADLRTPAICTLRECAAIARDAAWKILAGVLDPAAPIDTRAPAEALRSLIHGTPRKPRTRNRAANTEQLLSEIAYAYRQAVNAGDRAPRQTLADRFGYSPSHIARLIGQARKPRPGRPPLLGPAMRGKPGEARQEAV